MGDACLQEQARLIRERARDADAARRTWSFTLQVIVALILFALAPLVPRAEHLFGALSVPRGLAIMAPGEIAAVVSLLVYQRVGSDTRAYRIAEAIESFLLYFNNVAIAFATEMTWTVVWILCPFTAVFWAVTKPFDRRLYASIMGTAHALVGVAFVVRGDAASAWVAVGVGSGAYLTFEVIAREGRKNLGLEAQRNVAQARLNEAILDAERRRVATALRDGIGREIVELARELDANVSIPARAEAAALASEIDALVEGAPRPGASCSLPELLRRIDAKCRPLCADLSYASDWGGGDVAREGPLDANRAIALVRVAQELVRNAVVHGRARTVRVVLTCDGDTVTMRVVDDGSGLKPERFVEATGGLDNALQWVREHGGTLELIPTGDARGTDLRAMLPGGPRRADLTAS